MTEMVLWSLLIWITDGKQVAHHEIAGFRNEPMCMAAREGFLNEYAGHHAGYEVSATCAPAGSTLLVGEDGQ